MVIGKIVDFKYILLEDVIEGAIDLLRRMQEFHIRVKFSPKEIQLNSLFEKKTNVHPRMALNFEDTGHIFFFVDPDDFHQAAGRNFENLRYMHEICNKRVHIIKYSPDPVKLMKFCLPSIQVSDPIVKINGNLREMVIHVDPSLKPIIQGAGGHYIQLLNQIFSRLFKIGKVSIEID